MKPPASLAVAALVALPGFGGATPVLMPMAPSAEAGVPDQASGSGLQHEHVILVGRSKS